MLVHEIMTTPAVTVRTDDTVRHAAALLLHHRIASAPVVDDDEESPGATCCAASPGPDQQVRNGVLDLLAEMGQGTDWTVFVEDGVVTLRGPAPESRRRTAVVLARTVPGVVRVQRSHETRDRGTRLTV